MGSGGGFWYHGEALLVRVLLLGSMMLAAIQ